MPTTFEMTCNIPVPLAIDRLRGLLAKRGVRLQDSGSNIQSLKIPVILWNFSKFNYSSSNWVGINPFVHISAIEIQAQLYQGAGTKLEIHLNQLRGYVHVALAALIGVSVAIVPPAPMSAKFVFVIVFPCIQWVLEVPLIRYLIRREIQNELKE